MQAALDWIRANPAVFAVLWAMLGTLGGWAKKRLDAYPRWRAFFTLLAGSGLDLTEVAEGVRRFLVGAKKDDPAPPGDPPPTTREMPLEDSVPTVRGQRFMRLLGCFWLVGTIAACSWLTPNHVQDVASILACVLSHENEPPSQIAQECAVENVAQVVDILAAHRAAERREAAAAARGDK